MSRVADTLAALGVARSDRVAIVMGNEAEAVDGKPTDRCRALAAVLIKGGLKAPIRPRIRDEIWLKLLGNVCFNPLSALTRATMAQIATDPEMRAVARALMGEAEAAARALGVGPCCAAWSDREGGAPTRLSPPACRPSPPCAVPGPRRVLTPIISTSYRVVFTWGSALGAIAGVNAADCKSIVKWHDACVPPRPFAAAGILPDPRKRRTVWRSSQPARCRRSTAPSYSTPSRP